MNKPYWYCFKCRNKFKSGDYLVYKCPFCGNELTSYIDILGGEHDGGCGTAPDGTDCGECSYGDCSICPVWKQIVADKYSSRHSVYIIDKKDFDKIPKINANRILEACKNIEQYKRR